MQNLIIFGAGASYGSDDPKITPPLTLYLIEELSKFSPKAWGALNDEEKKLLQDDFEKGLEILSKTRSYDLTILQRAMALYFFQFKPTINSLYYQLAERIKNKVQWDGALITFNYERLLEISLLGVGLQPVINQDRSNNQIEICLPHGACHLFCESVRGNAKGIRMSGVGITTNGRIRVLSNPEEYNYRIMNDAFPPVMSYFEPQKRTLSGQNFINNQRGRYQQLIKGADRIAIIGLKVRENDNHIWQPLSTTSAKILFCSGKSAKTEFDEWCKKNNRTKDKALDGYFKKKFESITQFLDL